MQPAVMLVVAVVSPVLALVFVLWLAHFEETLPRDVQRARRRTEPAPILEIAVRSRPTPAPAVSIPAQRIAPAAELLAPELLAAELLEDPGAEGALA